jgi:hypothetical protein
MKDQKQNSEETKQKNSQIYNTKPTKYDKIIQV